MDRTRRGRFCSSNYILEALEKQRQDRILKEKLRKTKGDIDNKPPPSFSHLDGRSRNWKNRAGQINHENLRLLDSLKEINESDYHAKTEKVVGRMSIGNVGKGQTNPVKQWSDCYNSAIDFIRPKDTLTRPQKNEQRRVISENVKLLEKITTLRSPYDHTQLVREYNETADRNARLRATQPLEVYLARVHRQARSPSRGGTAQTLPHMRGSHSRGLDGTREIPAGTL